MILKRIKEYIDYKGINISAFERSIGMGNASFGKSLKRNGAIGTDKLEKILNIYSDISSEWLLRGTGEMIKKSDTLNEDRSTYQNKSETLLSIEEQRKLLDSYQSAQSEIESLKQEVKMKDKQLGDLIKTNLLLLEREKQGGISHKGVDSECASAG